MNQKPDPNKSVKPQDGGASSPAPSGADKGSENKQTKRAVKGAAQSVGSKVGKTMAIKGAINKAGSMLEFCKRHFSVRYEFLWWDGRRH